MDELIQRIENILLDATCSRCVLYTVFVPTQITLLLQIIFLRISITSLSPYAFLYQFIMQYYSSFFFT